MRIVILAIATGLVLGSATATFAAPAPTRDACEALAIQRGETPGTNHRRFMRDCMAGEVSFAVPAAAPGRKFKALSHDKCEALAEARGERPGGNHTRFIRECMAGEVQAEGAAPPPPRGPVRQVQNFEKCEALAEERGETPGRSHRTFIRNCMAGRIR